MKKSLAFLSALILLTATACTNTDTSSVADTAVTESTASMETSAPETAPAEPEPVKPLVNHMSATELASADLHEFTLLDDINPNQEIKISLESESAAKFVADADQWFAELSESEKEDPETVQFMQMVDMNREEAAKDPDAKIYNLWRVNGVPYFLPYELSFMADMEYDGGAFDITQPAYQDPETGEIIDMYLPIDDSRFLNGDVFDEKGYQTWSESLEIVDQEKHFESYDEYREWADSYLTEMSKCSPISAEHQKKIDRAFFDVFMNHTVEEIPVDMLEEYFNDSRYQIIDPLADYRTFWEIKDREGVDHIADSVRELNLHDDETGIDFLAHIVLPPDYDENKSYPAFVLTDAVWRFGDTPALYKAMEEGKAQDVILVTLGLNYYMDSQDMGFRDQYLLFDCASLTDFITDNLMPYLGEQFKIDFANSSLYGHSDGGAFTHYAAFNSDKYENQPFRNYIIGSPALWGLHHPDEEGDITDYKRDYDYFERNDTFTKNLFITAGKDEDPDYADSYEEGEDTTLEGVNALKERLDEHGVTTAEVKLYDSHHYQYIPEMLVEFLCKYYPA